MDRPVHSGPVPMRSTACFTTNQLPGLIKLDETTYASERPCSQPYYECKYDIRHSLIMSEIMKYVPRARTGNCPYAMQVMAFSLQIWHAVACCHCWT